MLPHLLEASPPGFGYPLGDLRPSILGSLFQLPTLRGFTLQSFPPPQWSQKYFYPWIPLVRFPA